MPNTLIVNSKHFMMKQSEQLMTNKSMKQVNVWRWSINSETII